MLTKKFNLEEVIAKRNQKQCGFIDLAPSSVEVL